MVYRIHFTVEDLARTWVAEAPSPLLEANLAVRALQDRDGSVWSGPWRRRVLTQLSPQARMVFDLVPPRGYTPMFLVPNRSGTVEEQLEHLRSTPRSELREEMTEFAARELLPTWARRLDDDPATLQKLAATIEHVYATAVAPSWSQVVAEFEADRAARARDFLSGGMERLLARLYPPRIRWVPPVLEVITVARLDGDLHLDGRGLLLVPTVFGVDAPTVDTAGPQPAVTYPARRTDSAEHAPGAHTAALLGRTRATVLRAIAEHPGCRTTELAAVAGVSPSSASEHASVLRTAGLITTTRQGQAVLHTITTAGSSLLDASGAEVLSRTSRP